MQPTKSSKWQNENQIDVVIPVFNQLEILKKTVSALKEHSGDLLGSIIFVDDASTEEGIGQFCTQEGRYVQNRRNVGFARTANTGAGKVGTTRFVLMNSDVEATPGWLDALAAKMAQDESYAVVAPLLLFPLDSTDPDRPAGMVQSAGFFLHIDGSPLHRFVGWDPKKQKVQLERDDLQGVTGACWLVKRTVWRELSGFEESYHSYFEDLDYCIRARVAGHKIVYTPSSLLYHQVGASWQGQDVHLAEKMQYFLQRNQGNVFPDAHKML